MTKIERVPLVIHLPPLAQLPRARGVLNDFANLLDRALEPARRFTRVRENLDNDVLLAVSLHALNALEAARALHTLSGTDHAGTVAPHFRTLFDAVVKMRWMRKHPQRARQYLQSGPFEQYALATERVKKSHLWAQIVAACKAGIAENPELLDLPKATKGPQKRPDFAAIAKALRMPDIEEMATAVGMDEDDYLIDQSFPSLNPHTSVLHTTMFMKGVNADGTARLSSEINPGMLLAYVGRGATRTGEVLEEVFKAYPDGALQFETEKVAERLQDIVVALSGLVWTENA